MILPNERHELYAKHRARGMIPSKAGIAAGYASGSSQVAELEKSPDVIARIEELMEQTRLRKEQDRAAAMEAAQIVGQLSGTSKAWVLQKLAENAQLAMQNDDYKAANEALKLIGDEFGMFKGASGGEGEEGQVPRTMDITAIERLMQGAQDATLQPPKLVGSNAPQTPGPKDTDEIPEAIRVLIEGQGSAAKAARARRQTEEKEADIAQMPESEPEEDDEDSWVEEEVIPQRDKLRVEDPPEPAGEEILRRAQAALDDTPVRRSRHQT